MNSFQTKALVSEPLEVGLNVLVGLAADDSACDENLLGDASQAELRHLESALLGLGVELEVDEDEAFEALLEDVDLCLVTFMIVQESGLGDALALDPAQCLELFFGERDGVLRLYGGIFWVDRLFLCQLEDVPALSESQFRVRAVLWDVDIQKFFFGAILETFGKGLG